MINFRRQQLLAKIKRTYWEKRLKKSNVWCHHYEFKLYTSKTYLNEKRHNADSSSGTYIVDIRDIKRWFIKLSLHCLRKKDHVKTTLFWERKLHGWWHCDKHRKRKVTYYDLCSSFFFNIEFQCPKGGYTFNEKTLNLTSVSSWIYQMTKCGQRVPHLDFWTHKSLMQQGVIFIIWHGGTRWQIYQMRSADMFIIIQMYRKRKVTYYELCSSSFAISTCSALRVDLMKNL